MILGSHCELPVGAVFQPGDKLPSGDDFTGATVRNRNYPQPIRVVRQASIDEWVEAGNARSTAPLHGLTHFYEVESD